VYSKSEAQIRQKDQGTNLQVGYTAGSHGPLFFLGVSIDD